ncbi:MAG: hypothetical protein V7754_19505 [Halioglobus sp.]
MTNSTPNYYDNWRTEQYVCQACKWRGIGEALSQGELSPTYFELLCPVCEEFVTLITLPTVEESRANWDTLSEDERKHIEAIERFRADFAAHKLTEESQLPDIEAPSFLLHWDFFYAEPHSETLIKHGDTIIFREPAFYEGYERFIQVAEILRARYGSALRDLIPTEDSNTYLYGDSHSSSNTVDEAVKRIFSNVTET